MYNVMGSAMKSLCFLSICILVVNAKRRDRFDIIEKRMSVVESRVSVDKELAKDMYVSLQQEFDELNNSMINFKDQMCSIMDQQTGKKKQTSSPKRVELLKSSRILVSLGLDREKQWTRDQVEKLTGLVNEQTGLLNQNFSELKNELKDDKEEMESNLEVINAKIDDKIQTKLSKLDEIITNNVKDLREVSLKSDTTEKLISAQEREIEALKKTQTKLVNVLFSANLINLENMINFEHLENHDLTCPSDWTKYSPYCYLYVGKPKTFSEARAHCKELGANLSDIENETEDTFIMRLKPRKHLIWIGYSDEIEEGTWISERTGQPASFTNFRTGEPDGDTRENCALMGYSGGKWYDIKCYYTRYFVCKKDAKMDIKF